MSAIAPWMTAADPFDRQPAAHNRAARANRFAGPAGGRRRGSGRRPGRLHTRRGESETGAGPARGARDDALGGRLRR